MAFLPGGDALVSERDSARILRVPAAGGTPVEVARVADARPAGEGGLLGLAVSPTYDMDGLVFAYVTTASDNRIVRFRLGQAPQPVLTGIPKGTIHNGGRLAFGPDGFLYAGTGETGNTAYAQDPASLGGKVLRMTPEGRPVPGATTVVFSQGHRNVQGLAFDDAGRLWASEFGQNRFAGPVSVTSSYLTGPDGPVVPAAAGVTARTTRTEYVDANGWLFASPVRTTVNATDPVGTTGTDQVSMVRVDARGRQVSRTLPAAGGAENTAATTAHSYYTATGTGDCVNLAFAGWPCKTSPAAAPPVGYGLPTSWVRGYDVYGQPTRVEQASADGTVVRTTDTSYDTAGRVRSSTSTASGVNSASDGGQALARTDTSYQPGTGRLVTTSTPGGDPATGTGPISRGYDAYGRLTSYTDGTGQTATTSYDDVGRVSRTASAHGVRTISYDDDGEHGSRPTRIVDDASTTGPFAARYGADGTLVQQTYPGGLTVLTTADATGSPASLAYRKPGSSGDWLRSDATYSPFGQVDTASTTTATGTTGGPGTTSSYRYDLTGRLTDTTDTPTGSTGPGCARHYTLDRNSNRTGLTQTGPATACPDSVAASDSYTYDTADRLQPDATSRATLAYDRFGRTRTLPSIDTTDHGGDLTIGYYTNDLVASQTQGPRTTSYTLDSAQRRSTRTDTLTGQPTLTTLSHYDDDTDNPDWTSTPTGSWTRNITGFTDLAGTTSSTSTLTLRLANLHGDVTATLPATTTSTLGDLQLAETTEYGVPRSTPAAGTLQPAYGYLGTKQRDTSTPGGLALMGVRLYTPTLGRFLTTDPIEGGSANNYDYVNADPVNNLDLSGTRSWRKSALGFFSRHRGAVATGVATAGCFAPLVGWAACAGMQAAALGVRAQQRAATQGGWRRTWKANLRDAIWTAVAGGLARAFAASRFTKAPAWWGRKAPSEMWQGMKFWQRLTVQASAAAPGIVHGAPGIVGSARSHRRCTD